MNKKGIATSLTWMIAILVILSVSTAFLAGVFYLTKSKIVLGNEESRIEIARDAGSNIILEKNFNSFLNRKVEFNEEEITILKLIENNPIEASLASDLFASEAQKQFEVLFPLDEDKLRDVYLVPGQGKLDDRRIKIHPYWIGIYDQTEEKIISPSEKQKREFSFGGGGQTETSCAPFSEEKSITLTRYTGDKKIILCVNKKYHSLLEGQK